MFKPNRISLLIVFCIVCIFFIPMGFLILLASVNFINLSESSIFYVLQSSIGDSLFLCIGVIILTIMLGVSLASVVTYIKFPGSRFIASAAILPLAFPAYLMSYILVEIDRSSDLIKRTGYLSGLWDGVAFILPEMRSMFGAILIFSLVLYPYIFISTRIIFVNQGGALIEMARNMGRSPLEIYRLILLPNALPAILASMMLVIMECLNDIGASEYLGVTTLAFTIYSTWLSRGELAVAVQLSLLLILFIVSLSWIVNSISKRYTLTQNQRGLIRIKRFRVNPLIGWSILSLSALPILFGFFLPALFLFEHAIWDHKNNFNFEMVESAVLDSFELAIYASLAVTAVAVIILYPHRLRSDSLTHGLIRLASYGYGVPGVILGLAILTPFGLLDNALNELVLAIFRLDIGLLFSGSALILTFAYLVRFMAVGLSVICVGYEKISRNFDFAARVLGRNCISSFIMIPTRLNITAIGTAFLLVFVDTIKELPMTLILRPLGIDTLATRIYESASMGQFEQASLKSIIMLGISLFAVILVTYRPLRFKE